jgi:uncharacterized protein YoxC
MGAIDNLSKEVKEYTTIYSDVLVGLHYDVKITKKEMANLKTKTNTAINKLNIVSSHTNKMITLNKDTKEEIQQFNVKIKNQKEKIENFVNNNKEDIIYRQQKIETLIENNEKFIQKSLKTIAVVEKKITNEYYLLLDKTNNLDIEIAVLDKYLNDLSDKNIDLNNKLINLEKEVKKRSIRAIINTIIIYSILTILTLTISYQYF